MFAFGHFSSLLAFGVPSRSSSLLIFGALDHSSSLLTLSSPSAPSGSSYLLALGVSGALGHFSSLLASSALLLVIF